MNFRLVRGTPFVLNGYSHVVVDGEGQLCSERPHESVSWLRVEVTEARDVCSNCLRRLLARLGVTDETDENVLRIIRGDYNPASPNRFWKEYGVTNWSNNTL